MSKVVVLNLNVVQNIVYKRKLTNNFIKCKIYKARATCAKAIGKIKE